MATFILVRDELEALQRQHPDRFQFARARCYSVDRAPNADWKEEQQTKSALLEKRSWKSSLFLAAPHCKQAIN